MGGGASKNNSRPATAAKAKSLGKVFLDAGVKKIIMIRHANAQARDPEAAAVEAGTVLKPDTPFANAWTIGDLTRKLTPIGEEQASAAMAWFGTNSIRAVICSEATRAIATKDIMTEGKFPQGAPGHMTLHTLHPARSGTPECEKMFDKLGYGTLNTYYADKTVEGCEGRGKAIFRLYVDKVTSELHALMKRGVANFPDNGGDTIAVFGHAVFLNAVAIAVGEAMAIGQAEEKVAEMELGEAQGILCDSENKAISLCSA